MPTTMLRPRTMRPCGRFARLALALSLTLLSAGCDTADPAAGDLPPPHDAAAADATPLSDVSGDAGAGDGAATPDATAPTDGAAAPELAPDGAFAPPAPRLWADTTPAWLSLADDPLYARHAAVFGGLSRFATAVSGPERPDVGHRGAFGTGNGRVFGFVGLADPLNTLHSLVGPTYERRERFFGDYAIELATADGSALPFAHEWAGRSLTAPIVVTRGLTADGLRLDTVDFAPWTDEPAARDCFFRILLVHNAGTAAADGLRVRVRPRNRTEPQGALPVLIEASDARRLFTRFRGAEGEIDAGLLQWPLGALSPGGRATALLTHCATEGGPAPDWPTSLDAEALLFETHAAYRRWRADVARVEVPDPLVAEAIEGLIQSVRVQIAETGASCPMSEYTRTWLRDNTGPVRAFLAVGAHTDVRRMLDYLWGATVLRGDLANSFDADLDVSNLPAAPDWDALAPLSGRVAAETPSSLVSLYDAYYRFTGDAAPAGERFGLLRRALLAQGFGPERLLPFSGDETFRAAMNATFGLYLDYEHHETNWSANSALLWLGAWRGYCRLAHALGRPAECAAADAVAAELEASFLARYILPDGSVSALLSMETLEPWPAPFEDVALQIVWSGARDGDDPLARSTLAALIERVRVAPGILQSPLHERYHGVPILPGNGGVYTGMLPGYTLYALAALGHPEAAQAFDAVRLSLDTSGNIQEYLVFDDHSGFSAIYDPTGEVGDYTAKFRPWEGGIVLESLLVYLAGFAPDAAARRLALRPHLPNDWPGMTFRDLRAGNARFDLTLRRTGPADYDVTLTTSAAEPWDVVLRVDAREPPTLAVQGAPAIDPVSLTRREHFGLVSAETPPVALAPGGTLVFSVHGMP